MAIFFDSEKQRDYWIYVLIGIFVILEFLCFIFEDFEESALFNDVLLFLIFFWGFIGKYILRYIIKIK